MTPVFFKITSLAICNLPRDFKLIQPDKLREPISLNYPKETKLIQ